MELLVAADLGQVRDPDRKRRPHGGGDEARRVLGLGDAAGAGGNRAQRAAVRLEHVDGAGADGDRRARCSVQQHAVRGRHPGAAIREDREGTRSPRQQPGMRRGSLWRLGHRCRI